MALVEAQTGRYESRAGAKAGPSLAQVPGRVRAMGALPRGPRGDLSVPNPRPRQRPELSIPGESHQQGRQQPALQGLRTRCHG